MQPQLLLLPLLPLMPLLRERWIAVKLQRNGETREAESKVNKIMASADEADAVGDGSQYKVSPFSSRLE